MKPDLKLVVCGTLFLLGIVVGAGSVISSPLVQNQKETEPPIKATRFSVMDEAFLGKRHLALIMDDSTKSLFLYSSEGCLVPYTGKKSR